VHPAAGQGPAAAGSAPRTARGGLSGPLGGPGSSHGLSPWSMTRRLPGTEHPARARRPRSRSSRQRASALRDSRRAAGDGVGGPDRGGAGRGERGGCGAGTGRASPSCRVFDRYSIGPSLSYDSVGSRVAVAAPVQRRALRSTSLISAGAPTQGRRRARSACPAEQGSVGPVRWDPPGLFQDRGSRGVVPALRQAGRGREPAVQQDVLESRLIPFLQ